MLQLAINHFDVLLLYFYWIAEEYRCKDFSAGVVALRCLFFIPLLLLLLSNILNRRISKQYLFSSILLSSSVRNLLWYICWCYCWYWCCSSSLFVWIPSIRLLFYKIYWWTDINTISYPFYLQFLSQCESYDDRCAGAAGGEFLLVQVLVLFAFTKMSLPKIFGINDK